MSLLIVNDKNDKILICGTNWLGDSIISMPAVQLFKKSNPTCHISILVKPALKDIWAMHSAIDEVLTFAPDKKGTFAVASILRDESFVKAYIFPNSFRSALIPYVAQIKQRYGMSGKWRSMMLTDIVKDDSSMQNHQQYEYMQILGVESEVAPTPELIVNPAVIDSIKARILFDDNQKYAAIIPGAARGDSKRWPDEYFAEVGCYFIDRGLKLLVLGSSGERALCQKVVDSCGSAALNLAGETSLQEFAAVLSLSAITVCNDSGGMHLAAAVGSKVVAIFGLTDPDKTGPLGMDSLIVAADGVDVSRDIPRSSERAATCLRSIKPARVIEEISSKFKSVVSI